MLNKIIKFSLDNKLLILLAAVLLTVAGIWAGRNTDIDVFPDLTAPTVVVMTDAHGMAPEEVERMVTFPIETAVNGATNVRRVRSTSMQGSSFVFVEFDWGMDQFRARQIVSEKLTTLSGQLPPDVTPVMAPQSSVMGEILFVGMQIKDDDSTSHTSMQELRTLAEWVVKPAILGTGGVSQVTIIGGDYKQYQIVADPVRMAAYGVTMDDLERVGTSLGSNSTGGVVRDFGNEYALRGMARTSDLETLGKSLVKEGVQLYDVADVCTGNAIKQGYASANAKPAIILSVSKQPNINTLKVTEAIEKNLANIERSFPDDVTLNTHIFRQADFISSSVGNVGRSLIEGAVFVVVVLFLFLGSFRTTLISIVAIPLSLLGTILCIHLMGMEINTMTLGGMCIAIGSLVDDAIIDVENVYKRLRENHRLPADKRLKAYDVVFKGSSEIRSSIIHATFIVMITFVPLFFLSGLEGRMLKPLGVAYLTALLMSLLVAMTVTPLLCKLLLSSDRYLSRNDRESWVSRKLGTLYSRMLDWTLRHKPVVVGSTAVLLVVAVALLFTMGRGFLPEFNEGSLTIAAVAKPGISLEESNKIGALIESQLLEVPEITSTSRRTGRGELDEHSQATNGAEIDVNFNLANRSKEEFMNEVRTRLASIPGIAVSIGQPLGHRIEHMVSGTQATIAIKIFGNDLSQLYQLGNQIKAATSDVEGLVDVNVEQQTEVPQLQLRPDRDKLARYNVTIDEFNHFVELAYGGEKLCEVYEGQRAFDLVLKLRSDHECPTIDDVRDAMMVVSNADGGTTAVPLSELCDVVSCGGPNNISRENVQRKLVVSANVSGRDAMSVVDDIKGAVDREVSLPEGYRIEYGGQFETAKAASRTLILVFILCLAVIYLLLYTEFRKLSLSLIVLLNLPLALIGGVIAVKLSSGVMSIPAIIGFITLFGIATRNGILLIAKYEQLSSTREVGDTEEIVKQGSRDKLNPILMTAMTTALSLIPMILAASKAGNEIQAPMAIVVLGGLFTSTLLNIFVVPVVYIWHKRRKAAR